MEEWREIEGTNGKYEISNHGRVKSNYTGKILKQYLNSAGYMLITIPIDNHKQRNSTHRLVAKAFIENADCKPFINHRDLDKTNNHVNNLEWCTCKENLVHASLSGVKFGKPHHEKKVIRSDNKIFNSLSAAARELSVPYSYVRDVVNGRQLTTKGFSFSLYLGGGQN